MPKLKYQRKVRGTPTDRIEREAGRPLKDILQGHLQAGLTPVEIAQRYGVVERTVYRWLRQNRYYDNSATSSELNPAEICVERRDQ